MHEKNLLGPNSNVCPTRVLIDQLADKWAILVMLALDGKAIRFNALRREVDGISQKMLAQTLRRLQRNGLADRRAVATMPMTVEYELTVMGRTLLPIIEDLRRWSMDHIVQVTDAQHRFDQGEDEPLSTACDRP